jgi:hypothetical protein
MPKIEMEDYMPVKRCFLLLLAVCTALPLSAATVSFLVIESGLDMDAGVNRHSGLWENSLLDVFFESGHIVSNAPVLRLDYIPAEAFPAEARDELDNALEGGVEYFIIALLEYQKQGESAGLGPRQITLRLFTTRPLKLVYEQKYNGFNPRSAREEYENLRKAASALIPRVK